MACSACRGGKRLVCSKCFVTLSETETRRSELENQRHKRDEALVKLQGRIAEREARRVQQAQVHDAEARLGRSRQRVDELRNRLDVARKSIQHRQSELHERQVQLAAARQRLEGMQQQTQRDRTTHMELQGHTYLRNLDTLCREQRHRVVRRALEIFPMALALPPALANAPSTGVRPADHALATICALQLPDGRALAPPGSANSGGLSEAAALCPQAASALGYVALLADVLSRFLLLPTTHRCGFCGGTTHVWQPDSFWDLGQPRHTLPLFMEARSLDGGGLVSAVAAGLSAATAAAGSAAPGGGGGAAWRQRLQDLQQGLDLLQRSVGTLVYARLGPDAALKVPAHWSAFAWLAGLCKMLAAEPRVGSTGGRAPVPGAGRSLAASAVFGRPAPHGGAASVLLPGEEDDGLGGAGWEEWEVMQRPSYGIIPPPPSQPEDVEHWTRAMLDTAPDTPRPPSSSGASPLGTRLRSLAGLLWASGQD